MTVETDKAKVIADGNGVAQIFSYSPIKIFETSDLQVVLTTDEGDEVEIFEGTGPDEFSVQAAVGSYPSAEGVTGSVTYPADLSFALPTGWKITIKRVLPLLQEVDLENQGGYFADVQETMTDKTVMQNIQQQEELDRAVKTPVSDPPSDQTFPTIEERANKFAAWDAEGDIIASSGGPDSTVPVTAYMETLLDDENKETAQATLDVPGLSALTNTFLFDQEVQGTFSVDGITTLNKTLNVDDTDVAEFFMKGDNASFPVEIYMQGEDSSTATVTYVNLTMSITDNTVGDHRGTLTINTPKTGGLRKSVVVGEGLIVPDDNTNPTDGDKGGGTINTKNGVFRDGVEYERSWTWGGPVDTSAGGTIVDIITNLPSGTTEVILFLEEASVTGANQTVLIQIGDSSFVTTGYFGADYFGSTASQTGASSTAGYALTEGINYDGQNLSMTVYLRRTTDPAGSVHRWHEEHQGHQNTSGTHNGHGNVTLSNEIERIRITTSGGTSTFDNGQINFKYR